MSDALASAVAAANCAHYASGDEVEAYLESPHHIARVARMLALLAAGPVGRLLDVGSSPAIAARLAPLADELTVMSLEADRLAWPPGVSSVTADCALGLPFPSGRFDSLFCGELIEHLLEPLRFLEESARVLVPGGRLILSTPNLATLQDRAGFLFGRAPRQVDPLHSYLHLHIRPFTFGLLKRCLAAAGFAPIRFTTNHVEIITKRNRFALPWLGRLFPGIGGALIVEARKVSADG